MSVWSFVTRPGDRRSVGRPGAAPVVTVLSHVVFGLVLRALYAPR